MTQETKGKGSNYESYHQAGFNNPASYPVEQRLDPALYRPIGEWMGRLILPELNQRDEVMGALLELYHTDDAHQQWVGKTVQVRWQDDIETNSRFWGVTQPVFFDDNARKMAANGQI